MSNSVTEFLHACEYGPSSQVKVLRECLSVEEKEVCCTQGALMAAQRHRWDTVEILLGDIDVGVQEYKLVHLALVDHTHMAKTLIEHIPSSAVPKFLWDATPVIFKHDDAEVFQALLNKLTGELVNPASLALSALRTQAFGCLHLLEIQCFRQSPRGFRTTVSDTLHSFITTLSFRNEREGQVLSESWENYSSWKQKNLLLKSLGEGEPSTGPRARKI